MNSDTTASSATEPSTEESGLAAVPAVDDSRGAHADVLEFGNPHFLHSLFANDESLLRLTEKTIGVRITTRDGWVKFDGDPQAKAKVRALFDRLEGLRRRDVEISAPLFRMALDATEDREMAASLSELVAVRLLGSATRSPVTPRTLGQLAYLRAMRDHEVVFGLGPAGTGKTYLAMAHALHRLRSREIDRIILTRPAVEAGETLGFLPGDLQEKVLPYLRPLYDALYDMLEPEESRRLIDKGIIEVAPLAYMRGRTLHRACVILDEAQNTSREQMLMFLTRLGENSTCVVTGDPSQIDLHPRSKSGLLEAARVLQGVKGIHFMNFKSGDVVRHRVVRHIVEAYDQSRSQSEES
jgi:phosphate starvation-inducible PhoH-like protein